MIMRSLLIVVVSISALPSTVFGQNCSNTSVGLQPSTYQRSAAHLNKGLAIAAGIRPIDGKIGLVGIGMSNAKIYNKGLAQYFLRPSPVRNPALIFVSIAEDGHTAKEWSQVDHPVWERGFSFITKAKLRPDQIQAAHIYMTNALPHENGEMNSAHLEAIVLNTKHHFPNLKVVYLSPIGYTGYAEPKKQLRVPVAMVHRDSLLMAEMVEQDVAWPPGVWVDFLDIWADGINPNPRTANVYMPNGISYQCVDVSDGVHPSWGTLDPLTGNVEVGASVWGRWLVDPVARWMFR